MLNFCGKQHLLLVKTNHVPYFTQYQVLFTTSLEALLEQLFLMKKIEPDFSHQFYILRQIEPDFSQQFFIMRKIEPAISFFNQQIIDIKYTISTQSTPRLDFTLNQSTHNSSVEFTLNDILYVFYPSIDKKTYKTTFNFFGEEPSTF